MGNKRSTTNGIKEIFVEMPPDGLALKSTNNLKKCGLRGILVLNFNLPYSYFWTITTLSLNIGLILFEIRVFVKFSTLFKRYHYITVLGLT
jgi:hypothetical protein